MALCSGVPGSQTSVAELSAWLKLFAAVDSPATRLFEAAALYEQCTVLLGHAEPSVQLLALDCVARWGQPELLKHEKTLRKLIADATFRETLALFQIAADADGALAGPERALVLPLLSRLLFSKLTQRSRHSRSHGLA